MPAPEPITTRPYRPEDADPLRAIVLAALEDGELRGSTRADVERWLSRLPAEPGATIVAVVGGEVAGLITPRRAQMVVGRRFRRRGVGTALVEAGDALARRAGAGPLDLALPHENPGATAFLRALGYRYHHSLWSMRLHDDAIVQPPEFPSGIVRHPYQDDDVERFVALVNRAFVDHPTPYSVTVEYIRIVLARADFAAENLCLVAPVADPDRLVAFCRVVLDANDGVEVGHIGVLGVLPEWRGRGLGRHLLRWGIHRCRALGAKTIELAVEGQNQRALRLYEETGFERVEESRRYMRAQA
jgi:mycothiol synthase